MSNSSGDADDDVHIDWTGVMLHNKYIAIKKLGYGSFASVWSCYCPDDKQFYACKIHNAGDHSAGVEEAETLNKFKKCDMIIRIVDAFDHEEFFCIVLELMACSLEDLMRHDIRYKNGFPIDFIKKCIDNTDGNA